MSTAITTFAPKRFAADTGTGADRPPSTYCLPRISTGWNTFGMLADARTACPALPELNTVILPVPNSVATAANFSGNC